MPRKKIKQTGQSSSLARRTLKELLFESDSTYLLKLTLYTLLAAVWLKLGDAISDGPFTVRALPIGLFTSLLLIRLVEHHQIDRKIMYATTIVVGIITAFLPAGIHL